MKSWLSLLENIPDCELKKEYIEGLAVVVRELDKSIQNVFDRWVRLYGMSVEPIEDMDIDYEF